MRHNIISTEKYLLVVDKSEIKEGDWIYNEEREPSVLQCIGNGSLRGWEKIIATADKSLCDRHEDCDGTFNNKCISFNH